MSQVFSKCQIKARKWISQNAKKTRMETLFLDCFKQFWFTINYFLVIMSKLNTKLTPSCWDNLCSS